MKLIDLTGKTYGRWTVQKLHSRRLHSAIEKRQDIFWLCRCECGTEAPIKGEMLRSDRSKSCGCLSLEINRQKHIAHGHTTHGKFTGPYHSWRAMRERCSNPNATGYHCYGGRGIRVCEEWNTSFEAFLRDMGATWRKGLTIERIDVNRHYEPGNCIWITQSEQWKNRRPKTEWRSPRRKGTSSDERAPPAAAPCAAAQ